MVANNAYINATVTFYVVDPVTLQRTQVLASFYQDTTGTNRFTNPLVLDGAGKNLFPVYFEQAVIGVISGIRLPDHDTGMIFPVGGLWRGDYLAGEYYYSGDIIRDGVHSGDTGNLYISSGYFLATSFALDVSTGKMTSEIPVGDAIASSSISTAAAISATASAATSTAGAATSTAGAISATASAASAAASADAAAASVVTNDFPAIVTAGTSTAYTINFTPNRTIANMFRMLTEFHVACGANPTLAIDGGTAYPLVDGLSQNSSNVYRSFAAGDIHTGMKGFIYFDSAISKYVFIGMPTKYLSDVLNGNNYGITATYRPGDAISIAKTFALTDAGRLQHLTGSTARTWTLPANASVAFVTYTEIDVLNSSTANLTLTAAAGVTVNGVTAGSITLRPNEAGQFKKLGTNTWAWIGANASSWAV